MTVSPDIAKNLNLLRQSPAFALRETGDGGFAVVSPSTIPADGSIYWLAGESRLPVGSTVPSVFVVGGGGSELVRVYWHVHDTWVQSDDPRALDLLAADRSAVFPFDWSYAIPVANDIFHA